MAFYPSNSIIPDLSTTPFLSIYDKQLFVENIEPDLDDFDIFDNNFILNDLMINQLNELYKILIFF